MNYHDDLASFLDTGGSLESDNFRAGVTRDTQGHPVIGCQVRDGDHWRDSCSGTTSLVEGLDLTALHGETDSNGLTLHGAMSSRIHAGNAESGTWQGRICAVSGGWINIEVTVELPIAVAASPELILWLGKIVTMDERQTHTFRQTLLSSPTVNCQGLGGNDLPVVYYYDPRMRVETVMYVPATHLTWTPRRFLDYRCGLRVNRASHQYGIGLMSNGDTNTLAAGSHRFIWYFRQQPRDIAPGEWEAQREMIAAVEQFIPAAEAPPPSWRGLSAGALKDLLDEPMARLTVEGYTGHPAYVRDTSSVRPGDRRPTVLEFMTQADVIPPLALYLKLHPEPRAEDHLRKLLMTLPLFHLPDQKWVGNWFPSSGDHPIEDIWYFLENALIKLPWMAAITGDDQLWEMFLDAVSGAEEMARRVHYVFPLFVDIATRSPVRAATNYSVGGMYAYGQMLAHAHTGDTSHLEEARIALSTLRSLTVDRMWHEPQQLGFAAAAAALLAEETGDSTAAAWVRDLLAAQLRMTYWDDHSASGDSLTGMFQGCASLLYPAFKENVESILPWPHLLRMGLVQAKLLLRLLDAQRRHNRAFFDVLRGETTGPGPSIPYENLGTIELPEQGRLGKELYGTGEIFWLYLMLEALGRPTDSEILVCSLDLPRLSTLAQFPPATRSFMTFNSTTVERSTTIEVPMLPAGDYTVCWAGQHEYPTTVTGDRLEIEVSLGAGEAQPLDVAKT